MTRARCLLLHITITEHHSRHGSRRHRVHTSHVLVRMSEKVTRNAGVFLNKKIIKMKMKIIKKKITELMVYVMADSFHYRLREEIHVSSFFVSPTHRLSWHWLKPYLVTVSSEWLKHYLATIETFFGHRISSCSSC